MDGIASLILSLISIPAILALPWYVGLTGLALAALLLFSSVTSLLTLRPIRAVSRLVMAFVVLVILSKGGEAIVQLIGGVST